MKRILVFLDDLFFAPAVQSTLSQLGYQPELQDTLTCTGALGDPPPALVIVQLDAPRSAWEPLVRAATAAGVPTLGFGPHVDLDLRQQALDAGVTQVVGRSGFHGQLPSLVRKHAGEPV